MGRRKIQWEKRIDQAGNVNKILPTGYVVGKGTWLRKEGGVQGGSRVTTPISQRKEELVKGWGRELGKVKR